MLMGSLWRALVGQPLPSARAPHERLTKVKGLAVFSSDALSSSAYATEEVLRVLVLAGFAALHLTLPISFAIASLLAIVAVSYFQTIHAYPSGGGAYTVSKENLGDRAALTAAAALLVDYVLTVAVSISAGVAAITSAFPALVPARVVLGVVLIVAIAVVNLRGVRESGTFFAVPTYLFLVAFGGMLLVGLARMAAGSLPAAPVHLEPVQTHALTVLLVFRAFASGCAALTGIEAVSNGIPAFYRPESRNASIVLVWMAVLLGTLFVGLSVLANAVGVVPAEHETVVSQVARCIFGTSWFYYLVQAVTALILVLAANTAFADFPRLSALVARDGFLPRQLANLGDRLVFNNGILLLSGAAIVLMILFHAETHALIPLYMVGVFISFTLSQSGMVRHGLRLRPRGWRWQVPINAVGALCTGIVGLIVGAVKFAEGAWMTILVIAGIMALMSAIHRHYHAIASELSLDGADEPGEHARHRAIIPVASVHRGVLVALRYADAIADDVVGVHVALDETRVERVREQWDEHSGGKPLVVVPSPYREVIGPLLDYLEAVQEECGPDTMLTLVVPEFVPKHNWHYLLHNQTAWALKLRFILRRDRLRRVRVLAEVPFFLQH